MEERRRREIARRLADPPIADPAAAMTKVGPTLKLN
jgi:hypothetical protein